MAINYPNTLPCPTLAGNAMSGGRTFLRSQFEYSTRQRGTFCNDYMLSFNFVAKDAAQMLDFKNFYYQTLNNGSKSFLADWEIEGSVSIKEFRFSSTYAVVNMGKSIYKITASFEMLTKVKDI